MWLQYFTVVLITSLLSLYYYFTRNFSYWKNRNVNGPKPVPIFGNIMPSALRKVAYGEIFKDIYNQYPNDKVIGIYRMTTPCLVIRDLDVLKHVLIKDFDVFADRGVEFSKKGLGANLFHADGDTWKGLKKQLSPIFTSNKIKTMLYLMVEEGDKFIEQVESISEKQREQEIHLLVQRYTLSTIAACAFGIDLSRLQAQLETLHFIDKHVLTINFFNELDMMYPGILKKINISLFPTKVKKFFNDLVAYIVSSRNGKPSNRRDFMDLLLEIKQNGDGDKTIELSDDIMAAQAFVFYIAGYETSATTISFMLYQLALNQDIQDQAAAEIGRVLEETNGELTYEALTEMTYLNKVLNETLRMYPILDPLQRIAKIDYKLPGTEVTVKKGQTILISMSGIHYDEKYYPNPEKFDPERFNLENSRERHPCAYLPFGIGQRNCIGMRFGRAQVLTCIVKMLSKFRFEPSINTDEKIELVANKFINRSRRGVVLNIIPRKY